MLRLNSKTIHKQHFITEDLLDKIEIIKFYETQGVLFVAHRIYKREC